MLPFFRKKLVDYGIFDGFNDAHSHILPGVDDGIKTLESSLEVLEYFENLGIRAVCCTPHIMEEMPNRTNELKEKFEVLKTAYSGKIELDLSAEYMMDNLLSERLESEDLLPYGPGKNLLLVETSFFSAPYNMDSLLEKVRSCGLIPVLAHPERYGYMSEKKLYKLYDSGIQFQMNIVSLTGCYGKHTMKVAERMYENGMYSFFGTDIHSLSMFQERIHQKTRIKI